MATEYDSTLSAGWSRCREDDDGPLPDGGWRAWVDSLTNDELKELEQARSAAGAGRDLRAELAAYLPR
ncbi:hypothetical protein ABZY42_33370 [Streptomyces sp. NPDC006622]|uniref:hypothetical protein n=1 Tax=Streptomyces sp. NPDC006622 TaxID=3155459 RepID=UPI0033A12B6D